MILLCTSAFAQVESGQIEGSVSDSTGAAVPGAAIVITNVASNLHRNALSSGTGAYTCSV